MTDLDSVQSMDLPGSDLDVTKMPGHWLLARLGKISSLKMDLYPDEVYTFTPKGKVVVVPADGTPVDFAYTIHTEVGHTCVGAKVNGRMVPLRTKLRTGDIVEIVTQKDHKPSRDWLSFVKSPRARNKIKHWLNEDQRRRAVVGEGPRIRRSHSGIGQHFRRFHGHAAHARHVPQEDQVRSGRCSTPI